MKLQHQGATRGYVDKMYSFKEISDAKNERLGPLVLEEMNLQEIHSLEIYNDVPEEADIIVLD